MADIEITYSIDEQAIPPFDVEGTKRIIRGRIGRCALDMAKKTHLSVEVTEKLPEPNRCVTLLRYLFWRIIPETLEEEIHCKVKAGRTLLPQVIRDETERKRRQTEDQAHLPVEQE